jgi:hypothetical protein
VGVKKFLIVVAAAIFAFATVAGCSSENKPAAASSESKPASDEQQIRDLLKAEEAAAAALDFDKAAELTCSKYREQQRKQADELVPPLSQFGTAEELAGKSAELAAALKPKFPKSSDATINALADALARYDQSDYEKAFLEAFRENFKLTLDKVENIKINGDTAMADVTSTTTVGDGQPETKTKNTPFVKEDGQWKDCESPS